MQIGKASGCTLVSATVSRLSDGLYNTWLAVCSGWVSWSEDWWEGEGYKVVGGSVVISLPWMDTDITGSKTGKSLVWESNQTELHAKFPGQTGPLVRFITQLLL